MEQKKGSIGVTTENIFPIIKKFLYSDHEIFLRELVSNAVDATTKLSTLSRIGQASGELGDLSITISLDEQAKTLTISDKGIGMTQEEVEKYINQIAFSGAEEFMAKYKDQSIIGHFGLGFYSAFMVADKVEIFTRSHKEGSQAMHWSCDGSPEYTLEAADKAERGTDIVLHISPESEEFAKKERIESLLKKYCSFLPVQIIFGNKQEWKDGKWEQTDEPNLINDTNPLWCQKPADISSEQYNEFYQKLYPMSDEPLFNIHLNVDYPFTLTGILYFPRLKNNFEVQKNKIQLYSNQVFVTDSVEGIVPEFLTLLHGVIDSPDIPLNVSRSYLQSDSNVKKISSHITKKVSDRLSDIFKENRADYESKWDDLKLFIQYGVVSDQKFGDRASEFTLLKNSDNKFFTLDEYASIIKDTQTNKDNKIVHLYTNDPVGQHSFVSEAKALGYDVLVMDSPLDGHFISFLENKYPDWSFVRVDGNVASKLIDKGEDEAMALSTEQQELLKPLFTELMPSEDKVNYTVEFSAMGESASPLVITQNEFMRRMKDMSRIGGGGGMNFYGEMPDSYTVVVNGNHPLVARLVGEVEGNSTDVKGEMSQLVDLALLSAGLLKGEKLTEFVQRSISRM
ncbi:MAG: molecular chaperone HtpG [Rikenellaceae bacterium]